MKTSNYFLILIMTTLTIATCFYWIIFNKDHSVESITYFPLDIEAKFLDSKTTIGNVNIEKEHNQFTVNVYSRLDKVAYLRQDMTLIYANGKLVGNLSQWRNNTDTIQYGNDLKTLPVNNLIRAITFHHGEIHKGDTSITSAQMMSEDSLYIISTSVPSLVTFRIPSTDEEIGWMEVLDNEESTVINTSLQAAVEKYHLDLNHYHIIPLKNLPSFTNKPLPSFSKQKSDEVIGKFWEGMYKNYFLGIKKEDGTIVEAANSTMPVILLAKNKAHLYTVFTTADGEIILLKQQISS